MVLNGLDLSLKAGAFATLSAPSGSGKSTLLNMIGCIDHPDSGSVQLDGIDTLGLRDRALSRLRNYKIGFIFQTFHLIPVLTARENVAYPLTLQGVRWRMRMSHADHALAQVGLEDHKHKRPRQLSGGQRQRVAIARAIVTKPKILLADEPTANLDPATALEIIELLGRLNRDHRMTLLVSTHDARIARCARRRLTLADGKIAELP